MTVAASLAAGLLADGEQSELTGALLLGFAPAGRCSVCRRRPLSGVPAPLTEADHSAGRTRGPARRQYPHHGHRVPRARSAGSGRSRAER
jgi:hypothetical protein